MLVLWKCECQSAMWGAIAVVFYKALVWSRGEGEDRHVAGFQCERNAGEIQRTYFGVLPRGIERLKTLELRVPSDLAQT